MTRHGTLNTLKRCRLWRSINYESTINLQGGTRFLMCTFDGWQLGAGNTWPWVWQCRNSLCPSIAGLTVPWVLPNTLWLPNWDPGRQHFWKAQSSSSYTFFLFCYCFSVAFLVTQSLDRLSLACAKAWGLATSPCFSHADRGAIVKAMEILSLHRHSGDRLSYRVELHVFRSLFAIQKYRTPFLFPCSGECWYAVAVEIFKLARLLPLLRAFFSPTTLLYFKLN
jgi:hypothetical protein